ncbi:DUF2848 family protein [Streptomyces sp. NPDC018947]|uniref:DUF2848 family protein n=1 Tax=Streptomyces sp. NPDC018947 TaxID=3365054 RepID=UPI0037956CBB
MTTTTDAVTLTTPDGVPVPLENATVVVAGYAGRDQAGVKAHIDELAAIGVAPPPEVPMFYPMPPGLLTTASQAPASPDSSGEVEPLIVRQGGRFYLGVASDHTDREIEKTDILTSKRACPKPVGATVVPFDPDTFDWDGCAVTSTADGAPYQDGRLAELLHPSDLFARMTERGLITDDEDVVVIGGTVPLLTGRFLFATSWVIELTTAEGTTIRHEYKTN